MKRTFFVKPVWDEEAHVWYADSDIIGLGIETSTLQEFEAVMTAHAGELIVANHFSAEDAFTLPLRDLVPTIVYHRPLQNVAAE